MWITLRLGPAQNALIAPQNRVTPEVQNRVGASAGHFGLFFSNFDRKKLR
jgi:hypothetical protein